MNIQIKTINEQDITPEQDNEIKELLCLCFPVDIPVFSKTRYWNNVAPRVNVNLYQDTALIAHLALIDRTITSNENNYRIAGLGNVCVHPNYQSRGLSKKLLAHTIDWAGGDFDLSFLFCKHKIKNLYARYGWRVADQREVIIQNEKGIESIYSLDQSGEVLMFYPLAAAELPHDAIDLNGINW